MRGYIGKGYYLSGGNLTLLFLAQMSILALD